MYFHLSEQAAWIGKGHINKMVTKRKVSQVFNNNTQGSRLRGWPKTDGGIVYLQIWINAKLQIGGRGPLRRQRCALDCSAIWEEGQLAAPQHEGTLLVVMVLPRYFSGHLPAIAGLTYIFKLVSVSSEAVFKLCCVQGVDKCSINDISGSCTQFPDNYTSTRYCPCNSVI
jgi:hypothetical protein